jgi:BRCA1-associated RING domain protein 1
MLTVLVCFILPVASQQTPEPGNKSSYHSVASKLLSSQSTRTANAIVDGEKAKDPALENQANDVLVHKGPCRSSQSSDGTRDRDCDSNDLEGELVIFHHMHRNIVC